jgi:ribonuclease HI
MELNGVIQALQFVVSTSSLKNSDTIQIFTDSVYVIRGITQWIHGWKKRDWKNSENEDVSNQDLWQQLDAVVYQAKTQHKLIWSYVKGHAGIPGNERCDQIAVSFSKNDYVSLYNGSATSYVFDITELPELRPLPDMKGKASQNSGIAWYISLVNGVFSRHETWSECEALVKGKPAKFKKVSSKEEEAAVKKSWGLSE